MNKKATTIDFDSPILVTGATGFIGSKVVESLADRGFRHIRCFTRETSDLGKLDAVRQAHGKDLQLEIVRGNLISMDDSIRAATDVAVIYHLALGEGGKSFSNSFMQAVIPTRNLIEAALKNKALKRFVNVGSFAVYSNRHKPRPGLLDECCPVDEHPELRHDAYAFGKLRQDQLVCEYGEKRGLPYVIVRPGTVYGPGKATIPGRVGIDTFGIFMHLGGSNDIPLTYVDNCAEAIVLAGIVVGVEGEVFNVVDDELPTSRQFLKQYKKSVRPFTSVPVPAIVNYFLCCVWEEYSLLSEGQLPPAYSRSAWHAYWKKTRYSNEKMKSRLGWQMKVSTEEGLRRYFDHCRASLTNA